MAPGIENLPDFSKGEATEQKTPAEFQPLFGPAIESQIWIDEPSLEADDNCDDLAAMVSQLEQLPTEPAAAVDADQPDELFEHAAVLDDESISANGDPAGQSELQAQHETEIETLKAQHAEEIERLQAEHNTHVIQQLEAIQDGLMEDVSNRIEQMLAASLSPLFQKSVTQASLEQLLAEIKRIVRLESVERISLRGPDILVTAASMALAGANCKIETETSDDPDLVVHLNEKILSTCIGDWSRKIEEALGA